MGEHTAEAFHPLEWMSDKMGNMVDAAKESAGEIITVPLKGIENQFKELNNILGPLIGMVVMGQVALSIAVVIGAAIAAKGAFSLYDTEKMLTGLLYDIEKKWPEIEGNLKLLIPAIEGTVDEEVLKRAHMVLHALQEI